jgi:HEAT repeats
MDFESQRRAAASSERVPEPPAVKAVAAWVQQFARTVKNCRLYDANNAAAQRFRQQLGTSLSQVLRTQGAFTIRFAPDDILCEGVSLYPAKSRDDNLALWFHRDGVRALTFGESIEPREVDALLDALLRVSNREAASEDEDLVTLLWEAQLKNVEVDYVPAEGDFGSTAAMPEGELVLWPTGVAPAEADDKGSRTTLEPPPGEEAEQRSDDWPVGTPTDTIEATYAVLQNDAMVESSRWREQYRRETERTPIASTIAIVRGFLGSELEPGDRTELAPFLSRVLRHAVREGAWSEAHDTLRLMRELGDWSPTTFVQELQQSGSILAIRDLLQAQGEAEARAFAGFAGDLGGGAAEVLAHVLAELEPGPSLRPIMDTLVTLCRATPETLAPWIADRRPAMVRAAVQILGAIGGDSIVGPLQGAVRHADPRVRADALQALKTCSARAAKPLLLPLLQSGDPRALAPALQKLSEARDPQVAEYLLSLLMAPEFETRPPDERRVIYAALGATGGDAVIPELEAELMRGNWFDRVNEAHRQAVARCIVRIGTPMARMVLEHGAASRRAPVRDLCREMLARWGENRGGA